MHHLRTLSHFALLLGSKLEFMMKLTWKLKFLKTEKLSRFMNFVNLFHFGENKENKWYQTFWKRDHSFLLNSYNQKKRDAQKAVILQEVNQTHNLLHSIQNFHVKVHYQRWKNKEKHHSNILKTIHWNICKDIKKDKSFYKNNLHKPLIKQKINMNTVCY